MTEHWESIRRCAELGVPAKAIAEKFGVTTEAMRKRADRENWLIPSRLDKLKSKLAVGEDAAALSADCPKTPEKPSSDVPNVQEFAVGTLAQIGDQLRHVVAGKALSALKKADLSSLPINNWQDAKIAAEVGLKAAGLDNASGPSVNVLFGGTGFGSDPSPLIEIEAAESPNHRDEETDLL